MWPVIACPCLSQNTGSAQVTRPEKQDQSTNLRLPLNPDHLNANPKSPKHSLHKLLDFTHGLTSRFPSFQFDQPKVRFIAAGHFCHFLLGFSGHKSGMVKPLSKCWAFCERQVPKESDDCFCVLGCRVISVRFPVGYGVCGDL